MEAREHLREALRLFDPNWEVATRRLFGAEGGILARTNLARVAWFVGDATGAAAQFEEALNEALASGHAPTIAMAFWLKAQDDMMRGDADATLRVADVQLDMAERNGLRHLESSARVCLSWVRARSGGVDELARFRGHVETSIDQGDVVMSPLFHGRLAELEAEQISAAQALISIDHTIETARKSDIRYIDALLHRIRGDILLKVHPDDPAPAEEAYLAAVTVAQQQGARSFGLLAALKLAKVYQSTARPVEAHDILAPALEGFSPTPEMAEIEEGQALLAALAETDEVKAAAASRERRLKLQTSYGQAMAWSKGYAAEETKAVLVQTERLAALSDNAAERIKAHHLRWTALFMGGELEVGQRGGRKLPPRGEIGGRCPRGRERRAGFGTDLPLSRPVRGGARTSAGGATCLQSGLGGIRPPPAWN